MMEVETEENVEALGVRNFLAARIQEVNSLSHQISTTGVPTSKGLAFQHVPKHMRRRAVSHNPKRLPKRLQGIHRNQVEKSSGSVAKKPKKPSRLHRRRPSNLIQEYNKRQREHKWLETHIWHAKRYHMHNKWGYRMPVNPTGKGYRAGYRAATKFCAMRDISFYSCFQLNGDFLLISTIFSTAFIPSEVNPLSLSSEMFKSGRREGTLHFYQARAYPFGYVGKVRFCWKTDGSALFLWVHPAQKAEILKQICSEFELVSNANLIFTKESKKESVKAEEKMDTSSNETQLSEEVLESNVDKAAEKLYPKKLCSRPQWINYSTNTILTDLEGVFNRFRLYGPLATHTLTEMLQVLSPTKLMEDSRKSVNKQFWWLDYYIDKQNFLTKQCELWGNFKGFSQVPCHSIIPLTVNDPRISIPHQPHHPAEMAKSVEISESSDDLGNLVNQLQSEAVNYPIFNETVRMKAIDERMSQQEFNKRQSKLLIPGSKLNLGCEENQVPIILIHRPNTVSRGFQNGGWDLIIPAGWAMSFWIALVYRSVRVVGLRESTTFEFESGSFMQSNEDGFLPPDAISGETDSAEQSHDLRTTYFKYPPAKRTNFVKLRCPFPFKIDWKILCEFHSTSTADSVESYYILRHPILLGRINDYLTSKLKNVKLDLPEPSCPDSLLIEVCVTIFGKGSIGAGAVICIPHDLDIVQNTKSVNLEEPPGDDTDTCKKRDELRNARDRMKTFMQKKRRKLRKQCNNGQDQSSELSLYSSDRLAVMNDAIDSLWLPDSKQVLKEMTRTPIGFIIFGRETYCIAKCSGIGYCTFNGLKQWFSSKPDGNNQKLVLVRDCRNSLVYRFAKLEIRI